MAKQWQTSNEITIVGGSDANSEQLRNWLSQNATQIVEPEITDLTGTKWLFNDNNIDVTDSHLPTEVSFISNNVNYDGFYIDTDGVVGRIYYYINNPYTEIRVYDDDWISNSYKTIEITGGTAVTNSDLISWLQSNATQIIEPAGNAYEITHSLTNLTHGNVSFTITPDAGYSLPSSVTVTNGTLVSYDSSTGVIVVSGDNAEISVSCEATAQSFSTIHLCGVYEAYGYTEYAINSSSAQTISQANNAGVSRANMTFALAQQYSLTLSDVSSLKIRTFDEYKIYASDGSVIADWSSTMPSSMDSDGFYEFISALSEGCYVCVYYND